MIYSPLAIANGIFITHRGLFCQDDKGKLTIKFWVEVS